MSPPSHKRISKFMSLILRHQPDLVGIEPDPRGWVPVEALLEGMARKGMRIDRATLDEVVHTNDKQRFAYDAEGALIRANQGHSYPVDLGYSATEPPAALFHGTATRFMEAILAEGLQRMNRHHVHLSANRETALKVGQRHGKPVILVVASGQMHTDGHRFEVSENGVWLTEAVPTRYLSVEGR